MTNNNFLSCQHTSCRGDMKAIENYKPRTKRKSPASLPQNLFLSPINRILTLAPNEDTPSGMIITMLELGASDFVHLWDDQKEKMTRRPQPQRYQGIGGAA